MFSAHYPPIHSSQAIRSAKLLKFLPERGWIPDIITVDRDSAFQHDVRLGEDIPQESRVLRVPRLAKTAGELPYELRIPDHMADWIPNAFRAAVLLSRRRQYSALMSLSFPASSHVAGLAYQLLANVPWLADFSDPWTSNPYRALRPGSLRSTIEKSLEKRAFERASRIGFTTQEMRNYVARFHPEIREKSVVIPNPTERTDFEDLKLYDSTGDHFRFAHIGSLYGIRQPDNLFHAFAQFRRDHPNALAKLRLIGPWKRDGIPDSLRTSQFGKDVEVVQAKSRKEALREMCAADVLVLIDPSPLDVGIFLPLKLVEYLMSGRPILALTTPGAASNLIQRYSAGSAIRFDDVSGIARALWGFYTEGRKPTRSALRDMPEFEARNLGRTLASVLDHICA